MEESKRKTTYVILSSLDGGKTWSLEGEQAATRKDSALSHYFEKRDLPEREVDVHGPGDVLFQAIPKSSWKALRPSERPPRIPFSEVE